MTKAQAKHLACRTAAHLLTAGGDWLLEADDGSPLTDEDTKRLEAAVEELVTELLRKGRFWEAK